MYSFCLTFTVDGKRMEEIVRANTLDDAKRIIKQRYSGHNVNFISTGHERM